MFAFSFFNFDKLEDYAKHFFSFLNSSNPLFPQAEQDKNFQRTVYRYFMQVRSELEDAVKEEIAKSGKAEKSKISELADSLIKKHFDLWKDAKNIKHFSKNHRQDFPQLELQTDSV